jgi:hypothetical protein
VNIRPRNFHHRLAVSALLASFAFATQATVIFGNLGTGATSTPGDSYGQVSSTSWAIGFKMASGDSMLLNTIAISASPGFSSQIIVEIRDNNPSGGLFPDGDAPGSTVLGTFTGATPSSGQGGYSTYTFSVTSLQLIAGTTYWAVIKNSDDQNPFSIANRGDYTGGGATLAGVRYGSVTSWFGAAGNASLELDASPVPESASAGTIAACLLLICGVGHGCKRYRLFSKALALLRR